MRMFTHRRPEGAQGHVQQEWLLDWILAIYVLLNRLLMSSFPSIARPLSPLICMAWASTTGGSTAGRLKARLTFSSWRQRPSRRQEGTAAYSGRFEPTGGPCVEHPVSRLLSS